MSAPSERGDRPISEIYREAQAVADFAPVMIISTPQGLEMRSDSVSRYGTTTTSISRLPERVVDAL